MKNSRAADAKKAARLAARFNGEPPTQARTVRVKPMPRAMFAIGPILGIIYQDAKGDRYIHRFRSLKSRPLLCVSPDGKNLHMLGGAYVFNARGIVDAS